MNWPDTNLRSGPWWRVWCLRRPSWPLLSSSPTRWRATSICPARRIPPRKRPARPATATIWSSSWLNILESVSFVIRTFLTVNVNLKTLVNGFQEAEAEVNVTKTVDFLLTFACSFTAVYNWLYSQTERKKESTVSVWVCVWVWIRQLDHRELVSIPAAGDEHDKTELTGSVLGTLDLLMY